MDDSVTILVIGFAIWLLAFCLQLADLGTARFDARRLARGRSTTVRLHPVAWIVPVAAIAIVAVLFGVVVISAFALEGNVLGVVMVATILVTIIVSTWFVITDAATRPAADSYRAIRDELIDLGGTRVWQEWLDELRQRLDDIDDATDRAKEPVAVSLSSAMRWVLLRPQRLLAPLLSVAVLVVAIIVAVEHPALVVYVVVAVVALAATCLLAIASAHASLTLIAAVRDAQVRHRGEVVHLLAEAEKTSKKRVAGLGDRVARALEILRQQQG